MRLLRLLPLFLAAARAQFVLLGDPLALINTSKPGDGFSIQDKLVPCNKKLVLIDLDSDVRSMRTTPRTPAAPALRP
jgi:hypothetical protein